MQGRFGQFKWCCNATWKREGKKTKLKEEKKKLNEGNTVNNLTAPTRNTRLVHFQLSCLNRKFNITSQGG